MILRQRRFNVDIIMPYISAMDHAIKLKFSSYVHLPSTNKMFHYCFALEVIMCSVGEVSIFEDGSYISGLEHIRQLFSSSMYKHLL